MVSRQVCILTTMLHGMGYDRNRGQGYSGVRGQGSGVRGQGLRAVAYGPFFSGFCGEMDS
jgi:hypothetical protein